MSIASANEQEHLRELAREVAEIAAGKNNERIKRRWCDVNALRKPDRAPVWCRPVGAWKELLPAESLRCRTEWLRGIEYGFRQILIKHEIDDDSPVDEYFGVGAVFDIDPPNVWGVDIKHQPPPNAGGAWAYDPPIQDWADLARLRLPRFTYNHVQTQEQLSKAHDLLGDILPVRPVCRPPLDSTLCTPAMDFRGMTQLMMDLIESPDEVHRMMAYLRDAVLGAMDQVQATGLLTPGSSWPMLTSDPIGPQQADGRYTYKNCWCLSNSQEFDQVSPAMWEEFLLDYQRPIFERFGLVAYGCCENLTKKMDGVLSIPNLRVFVCSAWTNLDTVIERVGRKHVIMWRQKASDVVFPDDVVTIRRDLEEGLRRLRGLHVQVVLRELQTLAGHMDRLHVWTRVAKEMAAKYA